MSARVEQILRDALTLPADERASLADSLLLSLNGPDPRIDALWIGEVEDRLAAYESGHMAAIPADEVFAEFDRP